MRNLIPALTLASLGVTNAIAQEMNRPNILLIMCDDLMAYDGIYKDYPKAHTPHLDNLKSRSVNFVNAHCSAPISGPSRASIFTGIYPHISKNYGFTPWFQNPVLSECKTLFTHLREGGYDVYGTGKLMHHLREKEYTRYGVKNYAGPLAFDGKQAACHPSVPRIYAEIGPLDGTFCSLADVPEIKPTATAPGYKGWYDLQRKKPFKYIDDNNRDLLRDEEHAQWVTNLLKELENKSTDNKPFFIGMGLSKPHTALIAPQKYFDLYPLETIRLPKRQKESERNLGYLEENTPNSRGYKCYRAMEQAYPEGIEYGLKKYMQAYLASVSFADNVIGTVLNALEKSRFAKNTIVIFFSDHGYDFGQKNYLFKNSLWETSTEVPFYVYCPGKEFKHGIKVERPISLIDVYPTINAMCGLDNQTMKSNKGAQLNGHSIIPFLQDGDQTTVWDGPDVALSVVGSSKDKNPVCQSYSVKSKEWRYIHYGNGKEELYHSTTDPHEWNNLADDPQYKDVKTYMYNELCKLVTDFK